MAKGGTTGIDSGLSHATAPRSDRRGDVFGVSGADAGGTTDAARSGIWQLVDTRSVGGIERHIAILSRELLARGLAVEVVGYQDHGYNPWHDQLRAAGVPFRLLPGTFKGLRDAMRASRPALVHTHGYKAGILGRIAAASLGITTVSTFHSGEVPPFPLRAYYWLDAMTSFPAARIAVSREIASRIPYPSQVIPSFVDAPSSPPSGPLPRRVGFVGRLSHEKAPDLFCEIARNSDLPVEWHVYGDGPMRAELEARYGDRIRFHGIVTDMSKVWPSLGAVLMPSRFEGLPLVALEALAAGIPVIASRVGGVPTAVVDGVSGWTFRSGDVAQAAACLARWHALDEEDQAALRLSCWAHVSGQFACAGLVPRIIEIYGRKGRELPRLAGASANEALHG